MGTKIKWIKQNLLKLVLLALVLVIGLFMSGVLQSLFVKASRAKIHRIEDKYDIDLEIERGLKNYEYWSDGYMDFLDEMNRENAGGMMLFGAKLYAICLQGEKATDLRFEYLYYHGITAERSPEVWLDIMSYESEKDNASKVVIALGYAYYRLFNNEYKDLMQSDEPHPNFEKYRPFVEKIMLGANELCSIPRKPDPSSGKYEMGEQDAGESKAHIMKFGCSFLNNRHPNTFKEFHLDRWLDTNMRAW